MIDPETGWDDLVWRPGPLGPDQPREPEPLANAPPLTVTGILQDAAKPQPLQSTSLGLLMNDQQMTDIAPGTGQGPADLDGIRPSGWAQEEQAPAAPNIGDVDSDHLTIKPAPVPAMPPGYVLDQISAGEGTADDNPNMKSHYPSGSGYDVVYGYATTPKPASQMSLPEVRQQQDQMNGPTPVGRYQINKGTIDTESKKLGLNGTEIFSPDPQDRMARQLLVDHGWNDFMSGQITGPQLGQKLSPIWSSLQDPSRMNQFQKVLSQVPRDK